MTKLNNSENACQRPLDHGRHHVCLDSTALEEGQNKKSYFPSISETRSIRFHLGYTDGTFGWKRVCSQIMGFPERLDTTLNRTELN